MSSEQPLLSTSALAYARMAVGIGSLVLPQHAAAFFGIHLTPQAAIMGRLFGVRDLCLGTLLWTASSELKTEEPRRELRRALWAGLVVDAVDVCSCLVGVADGSITGKAVGWIAGGASFFVVLAGVQLARL